MMKTQPIAHVVSLLTAFCFMSLVAHAQDITLTVRLLDDQGNPVAGAEVGRHAFGQSDPDPRWQFYHPSAKSDAEGIAKLQVSLQDDDILLLYAMSDDRRLVAFRQVQVIPGESIDITLVPGCRVHGRLVSSDMYEIGRRVEWTNVYLFVDNDRPLSFRSDQQVFEFYLPPGDYRLYAYGKHLDSKRIEITVLPDENKKNLGELDLRISPLAKHFGQPAPELQQIKAWRGGDPVTLEDLLGKVVILDFWGYWCGPCISQMPNLITLHDDFSEHGLEIIAVHDDSLPGAEELEEHLTRLRQQRWFDRDLPFRVALDGGGPTPIEGYDSTGRGATTAAYGITAFPTVVLIDREGIVVGEFHPGPKKSFEQLAKMLDLIPEDADLDALPTPGWKQRFGEVYQLAAEENVKRIEPPFIPERMQHIFTFARRDSEVKSLVYFGEGRNQFKDGTLGDLLQALASPRDSSSLFDCPDELLRLEIGGDWVVRETASLDERLAAAQTTINANLSQPIQFELVEDEQEVIFVTGNFQFAKLPAATDAQKMIYVTSDPEALNSDGGGGTGNAGDFFDWLSNLVRLRVINDSNLVDEAELQWAQCESAIANFRVENPPELDPILANLEQQTGLEFKRGRSPVQIWRVRQTLD